MVGVSDFMLSVCFQFHVSEIYVIRIYSKNTRKTSSGACVIVFVLSVTCMCLVFLSEYMEEFQCGGWKVERGTPSDQTPVPQFSLLRSL